MKNVEIRFSGSNTSKGKDQHRPVESNEQATRSHLEEKSNSLHAIKIVGDA